jgi:hypothetical protein
MSPVDLPSRSEAAIERFAISTHSADFWNDDAARSTSAARCFAGEVTPFEARFVRKRQPIHYVELTKRSFSSGHASPDARTPCP